MNHIPDCKNHWQEQMLLMRLFTVLWQRRVPDDALIAEFGDRLTGLSGLQWCLRYHYGKRDYMVISNHNDILSATDSIIKAKSGQVVVIGGLMQNKKTVINSGIPFLRDIPFIGALFGQKRESIVQSELVILIQPKVVDSNFHHEEMDRINERFSGFRKEINYDRR